MKITLKQIKIIIFFFVLALYFSIGYTSVTQLKPPDNHSLNFGNDVSIYGNYAIVGSCREGGDDNPINHAYIFVRNGDTWLIHTKITTDTGYKPNDCCSAVSISDKYAIIGTSDDDDNDILSGAAYIYMRIGDTWILQQKIYPQKSSRNEQFGASVAIIENYAIIGTRSRFAYIFVRHNEKWEQQTVLDPVRTSETLIFHYSVSISKNYAIIGNCFEMNENSKDRSGGAFIYVRNENVWNQQATLYSNEGEHNDFFGYNVAINQENAIVGASLEKFVYIFSLIDGTWTQTAKFVGSSVSINNKTILVGHPTAASAYIFLYNNNKWIQQAKLTSKDINEIAIDIDNFGQSVACHGNNLIIGQPGNNYIGRAYVYPLNLYVSGYVKDIRGLAFPGAKIQFENWSFVETDENGYYKIKLPCYNWSGKATITYNNYIFEPQNILFDPVTEDKENQNFSIIVHSISGYINDINGNPISGIEVRFSNQGGSSYSNNNGFYSHEVFHNWSGEVTLHGKGYKFTPLIKIYKNVSEHYSDQSYQGSKLSISGFCYNENNSPLSNVKLQMFPSSITINSDNTGFFSFDADYNWNGKVVPYKAGYIFEPEFINYNNIIISYGNQNFIGTSKTIKISGIVLDNNNQSIENVDIKVINNNNNVKTNADGIYEVIINSPFSGTITPIKEGYTFDPKTRNFSNIIEEQTAQNFIGFSNNYQTVFNVSPTQLNLLSKNGVENILIETENSSLEWTALLYASSNWINLSASTDSIVVNYMKNNQPCKRHAVIMIQSGEIKHIVEVIQDSESVENYASPNWSIIPSNYRYQGMITASIKDEDNNYYQGSDDLLAAFVENECRGIVSPSPVSDGKRFFLQVWSNQNNEKMIFKYYDSINKTIYVNIHPDIQFIPDLELGKIENPFVFAIKKQRHIPDANNDGKVDAIDAIDVLQYISNINK